MRALTFFIAGIITGFLLAPDNGANTRRKLSEFISAFSGDTGTDEPLTSEEVFNGSGGGREI